MSRCIEYINKSTYSYRYTYSISSSSFKKSEDYIYFQLNRRCENRAKSSYINYAEVGSIDVESLSLHPGFVRLGHVHLHEVICSKQYKVNFDRPENTVYDFDFSLYNSDYTDKINIVLQMTVHELAGCCQILENYVKLGYDIHAIDFSLLHNRFHKDERWDIQPYQMFDISKGLYYTDYIKYLEDVDNKAYRSCFYSFRKGEYGHGYWETFEFRTKNKVFAQLTANALDKQIATEDDYYIVSYSYNEQTDYSGGLSAMIEKEGTFSATPNGEQKKILINRIINSTHRVFPSEIDIISEMIKKEN